MTATFRIELADGAYYEAGANENLLAAAQRAHWLVRYGCRNGNCDACAAKLLRGAVKYRDGEIVTAPAAKILLCLCQPLADLRIELPSDPLPGSFDRAQRCYALLQNQIVAEKESILLFALPAGRKPILSIDEIALIETDAGLLQARIDPARSQGRELVAIVPFASPLQENAHYHVRYPIGAARMTTVTQDNFDE